MHCTYRDIASKVLLCEMVGVNGLWIIVCNSIGLFEVINSYLWCKCWLICYITCGTRQVWFHIGNFSIVISYLVVKHMILCFRPLRVCVLGPIWKYEKKWINTRGQYGSDGCNRRSFTQGVSMCGWSCTWMTLSEQTYTLGTSNLDERLYWERWSVVEWICWDNN